jgi:hypothetical protein
MRRETSCPRGGVPRPFSGTSPRISLRRRAGHLARARQGQRRLVRRHEHRSLAYGDATNAQRAVVLRGLERHRPANEIDTRKFVHERPRPPIVGFATEALKELGENQVTGQDRTRTEERIESVGLTRGGAVEIIDPDGRIDQDHELPVPAHGLEVTPPLELAASGADTLLAQPRRGPPALGTRNLGAQR